LGDHGLIRGDRVNDRYELEELLGRGGMGEVWRARHLALNSPVAIKFLNAAGAEDKIARKRFVTEAQVTAQLKTRHAVQVFDFGFTEEGRPYIVMELLDGETVGHRIERLGRLPPNETVRFLQQAARALDQAHALGIVHRDFKPDNLVIVKDETGREFIKVLDFGIAKLVGDLEAVSEQQPSLRSTMGDATIVDASQTTLVDASQNTALTGTNSFLGTPPYMAPEQVRREATLGAPADIWAFGVVAFECLTGYLPFGGNTLIEVFTRIQKGRHAKARELRPELPAEVDEWFSMAFAAAPAERFASALVAARALAVSLESRRWEKDMPVPPFVSGSGPILAVNEPEADENTPLSRSFDGTSRLLARARKHLDTHEPVSAPVRKEPGRPAGEKRSAAPSLPPPSLRPPPAASGEKASSRRWLIGAAFAALVIGAGIEIMRAESPGSRGAPATSMSPSAAGAPELKPPNHDASADAGDGGRIR
jgi:serine/threonine protein kinase